ncbi:PHP-associated domain-containing protein [Streptomyces sp. BK340]|uniref:PHP-associated domain-containing protein n=1 Tax=Streptomyces sp. BK340 TaxID=2572903 RepID=UPI0011A15F4D|nr:PHP-associated domain-containing protein [Streptomyces sp. BK340]TVZ92753.1 PHP domain-containing protein [Streptomyces sp. BK340]
MTVITGYDETTTATLLDAGAVLPPGSTAREDADGLTVRTYTHPALDGRQVVRLVPGTLGEAEDLALEFLGLAREPDVPEVGQVRKETLGFPAWALVNDPANGHHALALVKDVERLARQAKSRPGTAKEGFEALGEQLGRAVPHFLPTFYEQAARAFLQHENTTYAAAFFGKAREAERVHALAVDEERQRAVFLEFAFAGALTVKALKEHVKDLARRLDPAAAWAQFRQLTVERCAAGMPPYASLPQDARGLIRAAGLDRATEECALVADLLASPAAVRAPASFWNSFRTVLPVLAERQPAVRARLLEIMPAGLGREVQDDEFWLTLLAECGAERLLTEQAAAEEYGVDPADWLSRWALFRKHGGSWSRRSPGTLALVERMAAGLRAAGRPVDLFTGRWHAGADLDLLDLCVAEGVPLTVPGPDVNVYLALTDWLKDTRAGRRDLVAVAADPRLRRLLHQAVEPVGKDSRSSGLLKTAAAHPVLSVVLREWLDEAAGEFTRAVGLPRARAALDRLRPFRTVASEAGPDAVARVAGHEVAPLLGRTLRAGILDELGWAALDEALELLDAETRKDKDSTLTLHEAWPALIVVRGHKAIVVGPDGILLEHDLRLPQELDRWQRPRFRYVDGELLVMWRQGRTQHGYWSARPTEVVELGGEQLSSWWSGNETDTASVPLPDGGRATGGRTLHAGDTVLPPSRAVIADGTTYWRQGRQGLETVWLEYDPATGTHGRASLPALLRAGIRDETSLLPGFCEVLPLRPGLEDSPFGTDGTVLGRWVRAEGKGADARRTAGTPDGRTVSMPASYGGRTGSAPLGALRLPGGAEPVAAQMIRQVGLFASDDTSADGELGRVTPNERGSEFAAGTRLVPPLPFWHALRPRDEQGSAVLRALTDERAAELLRVTALALEGRRQALERAGSDEAARAAVPSADHVALGAVALALPGCTDGRLLTGVTSLVRVTLRLTDAATTFANPPQERPQKAAGDEEMFADYRPRHGDDRTLNNALSGVVGLHGGWYGERWSVLRQIRAVNHVLSGGAAEGRRLPDREQLAALGDGWLSDERTIPGIGTVWPSALGVLRALAHRAASPALSDARREPLLLLLEAVAEGPLAAAGGNLREIVLNEPHDKQQRAGQVLRREGRTVVILGCQSIDSERDRVRWLALDHDPSGAFGAIAHFALESEVRHDTGISAEDLATVTRLIRDKGAAPWRSEAPEALVAATDGGLGPLQAAVLLAGLPQSPGAEGLAVLGLKPRQCEFAVSRVNALAQEERNALLGALLPADPADLWTTGPDTAAAGRGWAERLGSLVRVPEELAADLAGTGAGYAEDVLNPSRTPWLARTTVLRPDKDGNLAWADPGAIPGRRELAGAVNDLAALAYVLPYGHPLRAYLPEGLAALRRRMADPELLLDLDVEWTEKGGSTAVELRRTHGLPETGGSDAHGLTRVGEALVLRPWYRDTETVLVRPAALTGPDDTVFGLLEGLVGGARGHGLRMLRTLLGDDLARAVEAGVGTEGPSGYAQDPTVTVPALVAEAAAAHGLGEDAAALYLMLLALPDPTDRNCARWTGWKPARMKKARAELAATDLVVEAKRPRAGRSLFLPCGWRELKSPALPVEIWKEGLYPVLDRRRAQPLLPVPELFARAWERVRTGDAPAYEELTTRATRRGRRR